MAALLNEATSFAQATEQRWSKALEATIGDDIKDVASRARSLLTALGRLVIQQGQQGPVLPQIPLAPAAANELSLNPDATQRDIQHGVAVIHVLVELAQAIESLGQPTGLTIELPKGTTTSWWTQHGFNHVQYKAEMATRVVSQAPSDTVASRYQMSRLAQCAWTAGLPEAGIVYLVGALDPAAEATGPLARAYSALTATARVLAAGDPVPLDTVVPLARFWLDELMRRLSGEPGGTTPK